MRKNEKNSEHDFPLFKAKLLLSFAKNSTNSLSYMDLHSMSVEQAKAYVFMHVRNACSQGMGHCRIITGRGNHVNAKGGRGVLFELCEQWLQSEELKPLIKRYEKKIGHYLVTLNSPNNEFADIEKNQAFCAEYFENLRANAAAKDAEAQYELACCYSTGLGELKANPKTAFKWYLAAAKQGHPEALGQVGHKYLVGEGVKQSDELAIEWFTKAANKKNANAAYTLSSIYLWGWGTEVDGKLAISWAAKSANWGDIMGMRRVGGFFNQGFITQKSPEKAFEWYFKAAELGDAYSQYQIGIFLHAGIGTSVDKKKSFDWILLAAEGGDTDAMMMVGQFYLKGDGCQKDIKEGLRWLKNSASLGNAHAGFFMGEYYLKQDKKEEALTFFQESAERGSILAQAKLFCLKQNHPIEQNKVLALLMEQPADDIIEKTPPAMQMALGSIMLNPGKSQRKTKQNQQKGLILLESAARKGQSMAYNELGYYFAQINLKKAAQYWEKGAHANDVDAMFMMGLYRELYLQKPQEANEWFKKAAEANHPGALFRLGIDTLFKQQNTDETSERTPNYLKLALEQAEREVKSKTPDFVSSYRVLYKTLHAIGVFLIYINQCAQQEDFDSDKNEEVAYEYYRQSAKMGYHKAQFDLGIALVSNYDTFQEGIDWLTKAAEQNDERAEQAIVLYQQFSNLPELGLAQFNLQLGPIIERGSFQEKIGFTKTDFKKIVADYFSNNADLNLPDKNKKKGKAPANKHQSDIVQHKRKNEREENPSLSELLIKNSALFQREQGDTIISKNENARKVIDEPPSLDSMSTSSDSPIEQEDNRWWCCIQ